MKNHDEEAEVKAGMTHSELESSDNISWPALKSTLVDLYIGLHLND